MLNESWPYVFLNSATLARALSSLDDLDRG